MPERPVQVVFIASDSRSGSTLLDMALGQAPGFFSGGELRYIWRRNFARNNLCGCGETFADCPFWTRINERLRAQPGGFDPDRALAQQKIVDDPDIFLRTAFFSPVRFTRAYRDAARGYLDQMVKLYRAIQRESGCDYIVDSSKSPSHGFLLRQAPGLVIHVVHLVRDCRAVAWSLQRREHYHGRSWRQSRFMSPYPPVRGALRNMLINTVQRRFARASHSYTLLRYEDFIHRPRETLDGLLARVEAPGRDTSFIEGDTMHAAVNHTASGNPCRFDSGAIRLALDDEWRYVMPPAQRRLITCLAAPMLRRYGYSLAAGARFRRRTCRR